MLLDQQNVFAEGVLAANSDVIDMGAATNLGAMGQGLGLGGEGAEVFTNVSAKANADNTLAYNLVGADSADMLTNKITVLAVAATNIAVNSGHHARIPHHAPKRFFRLESTFGGTTPSVTAKQFLHTTGNLRPLAGGPGVI